MISRGAVGVGVWLTAAALLWAACDVIENKKFPNPNPPTSGGGATSGGTRPDIGFGIGGWKGDGAGGYYGGAGGYGGFGGGRIRPDAGIIGVGGSTGLSCGFVTEGCIASCYTDSTFITATPICDPVRATWVCPPGMVLPSTCPPGACATTFLYCCDTVTGAREPAACTQGGYRGQCPANYNTLTEDSCFPDGLAGQSCTQLQGRSCSSANLQCHQGGYDCFCMKGDGGLVWSCPGLF